MAKRFRFTFAFNGDRVTVPDSTQGNGAVSYQEGYGPQYSLDVDTDPTARRINREPHNQIFSDVTENIQEWQQQLAPDFITPANNGGPAYPYVLGMVVWDGTGYRRSTSGNNTADVSDDNNWEDYDFSNPVQATETVSGVAEIATNTETSTGTDDARIVTPLKLSNRLSQLGVGEWQPRTSSFQMVTGLKYNVTATSAGIDATVPATLIPNRPFVVHNNAESTENIRVVNNGHTIYGAGRTITPADNIVLPPGRALYFIATSSTEIEGF